MNKSIFTAACLALAALLLPRSAAAQSSAGLTVIPPKLELFGNPGETITENIRIKNNSEVPMTFGVLVEDFSSAGEEGKVVLEESGENNTYSLKAWIELSAENIFLQPQEEQVFPFNITIPRNADPGGHYASVLFQIGSGQAEPGVTAVQHRVGSLILLRVAGNVVEEAVVETFDTPVYAKSGPVSFNLRLQNNGTTHIRPTGTIIITNIFGNKVDEIPLNSANVFPGAIRKMDTEWNPGNVLGHYTATLVATYGQTGRPVTAATKFTVASPVALVMLGVGSIAAIIFILSLITGRKRVLAALKILSTGK